MKKIMFSVMLIAMINGVYGMEIFKDAKGRTFNCLMFPNIVVVQDDINKRCTEPADITIVGMNERRTQFPKLEDLWKGPFIGSLEIKHGRVEARMREQKKSIGNQLLFVTEPQIFLEPVENNESFGECQYIYKKAIEEAVCCSILSRMYRFAGNEAIKEALDDLCYCYNVTLKYTHRYFTQEHRAKSIALPQLGVSSGIPTYTAARVAVASAVRFITHNLDKDKYKLIELVVRDSENFNMYKQILLDQQALIKEKAALKDVS
jgi:hypothetical protein